MSQNGGKLRGILHPTDFSPAGVASFCHALRIAVAQKASLHLLHVELIGAPRGDTHFPRVRELAAGWGLVPSGIQPDDFEALTGVVTKKTVLIAPDAARGIASYAEENDCGLLIMATRDKPVFRRLFGGSVSEAAARASDLPALFLRESQIGFVSATNGNVSLNRILIPVDGRLPATPAIAFASNLAKSLGQSPQITGLHIGKAAPAEATIPNLALRDGPVVEAIVGFATEIQADLIVMPTDGHDSAMDTLFGSTTERVIHEAPCPVLAFPRSLR